MAWKITGSKEDLEVYRRKKGMVKRMMREAKRKAKEEYNWKFSGE